VDETADRRQARATEVAEAARRLAGARGVHLPDGLRLWALAAGTPDAEAPPGGPGVGELADVLEAATDARERRANGLHVTPRWVADHLVRLAMGEAPPASVCDPACGGGAFLLAAARALHAAGVPRGEVVRERLWGADIDDVGLATAEAALALWSGGEVPPAGRLVVGDPLRHGADLWPDRPGGGFGMIAGNPPFQSQLGRATARDRAEQARLRERFGAAVRPYTDTAWLFLLLGCELARAGGTVVLVEPDSLVAARDATALRDAVDRAAELVDLWVDDRRVFTAAVRVCAPILRTRAPAAPAAAPEASVAAEPRGGASVVDGPGPDRWRDLLADRTGVPRIVLVPSAGRLRDRATLAAGFRDEYYGLAPLVVESGEARPNEPPNDRHAPLITAGAVEWGRTAWGERPARFAKRVWQAPAVDLDRLDAEGTTAARRWVDRTRRPKLVVATQTRVVEVAVDEGGTWVPSVPALAVVPADPGDPDDLWALAAALASPAATAWLLRRAPGAALGRGALKVAARDLAELPLPTDAGAWADATAAFRAGAPGLDAFTAAAAAAYGSPPDLVAWWRERLGAAAGPAIPTGRVGETSG
jgi:hypothetical protein